jgi:hypothetical protein
MLPNLAQASLLKLFEANLGQQGCIPRDERKGSAMGDDILEMVMVGLKRMWWSR